MCGLDKSIYINNQKQKNEDIIYLPIGGDLTTNDIIEKLKNAMPINFNDKTNNILNIDLGGTNDIEIVKDFLFKLLILNKYNLNENVIYFKQNVKIYIELSNNFNNYLDTYKILNYFKLIKTNYNFQISLNKDVKIVSPILKKYENNEILNTKINIHEKFKIRDKE